MAININDPVSITGLINEFSAVSPTWQGTPASITEFYRNSNANIPSRYTNIPTSGTIAFNNFWGTQGFNAQYESTIQYMGPYADPSPRQTEVDLGATVVSIDNTTGVKVLKKTVSVANTAGQLNRWVIVATSHFHWNEGNAGAAMFGNFRPLDGSSTVLKSRVAGYAGETHKAALYAFQIPQNATTIELAWDHYGYGVGGTKDDPGGIVYGTLWGEVKFNIFTVCGLPDTLVFRNAEDANWTVPNGVILSATESNTTPKKTIVFIVTAGRLGTAGACTNVSWTSTIGGLGFYFDLQANALSNTYEVTHSAVTLTIGIAIDY